MTDQKGWENFASLDGVNKWLVFTSENCVRYFFGYLKQKEIDLRAIASYKIAAVGFGTLRTLHTLGYYPDYSPGNMGMAEFARLMSEDIDIESAQIVRVRGHLPNDPVAGILEYAGAEVYPLCVYKTDTAEWQENEIRRLFHYPAASDHVYQRTVVQQSGGNFGRSQYEGIMHDVENCDDWSDYLAGAGQV